ncbi:MAG TPA: hypothetical protein VN667_12985 [Burkholderiales bacterium]|nr:hypothetical protein [Burkholderiales bacterium]
MSNAADTITELRKHLFDTLRSLGDKDNPMDIKRAMAVANVANAIIHSAKVEVDHMRLTGGTGSGFIPESTPALPDGVVGRKVHRLKG